MGFKVFEKGSAPFKTVPAVTVQKRGLISINRAAYSLIDSPSAVELLWDEDAKLVALRPAAVTNPNAYQVRPQASDSSRGPVLVAGQLFTRHIGLDTSQAVRWIPYVEDGMLIINLSQPGQKVTSNRNRSRQESDATGEHD